MPFVHARVVLAERPTSAKPGDEAIVLPDGSIEGFVGGSCAESTVREAALGLLESGRTVVLRITPDAGDLSPPDGGAGGPADAGRLVVHNPCLSGGTLEVFLEPEVPPPLLVVLGQAPIARALHTVGTSLGYDVRGYEGGLVADTAAVVVASHGRGEEAVLEAALRAGVPYVGLVASRTRGEAVVGSLDVGADARSLVRTPAGLDIGAHTPEEVALAILAEIVSLRPRPAPGDQPVTPTPAGPVAMDPVCGMAVAPGPDAAHVEHEGATVWFCGSGCMRAFRADPAAYLA